MKEQRSEEVLKPALYDLLVFAGGDGDLALRLGIGVQPIVVLGG